MPVATILMRFSQNALHQLARMTQVATHCVRDCSDILLWRSEQKIQRKARRLRNAKKKMLSFESI